MAVNVSGPQLSQDNRRHPRNDCFRPRIGNPVAPCVLCPPFASAKPLARCGGHHEHGSLLPCDKGKSLLQIDASGFHLSERLNNARESVRPCACIVGLQGAQSVD
jgi:hypothetical protein